MKIFLFTVLILVPTFCLAQDADNNPLQNDENPALSEADICFNSKCCIINKQYICPPPPESGGGHGPVIYEAPDDLNRMLEQLNNKIRLEQLGGQL